MEDHVQDTNSQPIRIAIIGAGIGGLTLSAALGVLSKANDLEIYIYESAASISEIGAGITLWPRVWEIMNAIDLGQGLLQFLQCPPDDTARLVFQLRKGDQKEGLFVHDVIMQGGSTTFHRADLQQTLVNRMSGRLHLGHRFMSLEEKSNEVVMHFQNGATATCDLLIGMDGIKSAVRKSLLAKQGILSSPCLEPVWSGTIAYRGLVSRDVLDAVFPGHRTITTPMMYIGKGRHVVAYAISRSLINVAAFVTYPEKEGTVYEDTCPSAEEIQEELVALYTNWEPEVQVLIKTLKQPLKWPINQVIPLDSYAHGRVIIAGDAAHGMPPHQGSGASTAIEDAYILANLLSSEFCTKDSVLKVPEIYNEIRCLEGNRALDAAIETGKMLDLNFPGLERVQEGDENVDPDLLHAVGKEMSRKWEWVWKDSAEVGKTSALESLKAMTE
ncbi:hypothetical protein HYPSUDRAFT_92085 [Hypholoma sublateritium FD-334 SS-4]|uniref:FAD-binding domain-containing protein n=1 Tax=Hypholoma sublateritium (strain FD-334 SS-4) TaxID=945553 RepID=A0A0D2KKH7_HYPSF|nr:hypothetical protein HYPSUDRAFT_92085 [Hypholoma sublateritium FD-334 SS-4]